MLQVRGKTEGPGAHPQPMEGAPPPPPPMAPAGPPLPFGWQESTNLQA